MSVRITCINKSSGYHADPHHAIEYLGWTNEQSVSGDLISVEIGRDGRRDFVHPFSSAENYLNRLVLA